MTSNNTDETPSALTDVDLHVHTHTSACGYTSHRRLLELTRAAGRRVVAVTDHDSAEGAVAVRDLARLTGDDVLVLTGMELTTSDQGHVVIFGRGVEEEWGWRRNDPFPENLPDHWVAIKAHPFRTRVTRRGDVLDVDPPPAPSPRIDAVELWNAGDILKKAVGLRADYDRLSRDYVNQYGKVAVAASDGHRPTWVHTFFTRFARPLESVDDLVQQIRDGQVTPMASAEDTLDRAVNRWWPRAVVEWHEAGLDWRHMALASGYEADEASSLIAMFERARDLVACGATISQIAGELTLSPDDAADYVSMVEEEAGRAARRPPRPAATQSLPGEAQAPPIARAAV